MTSSQQPSQTEEEHIPAKFFHSPAKRNTLGAYQTHVYLTPQEELKMESDIVFNLCNLYDGTSIRLEPDQDHEMPSARYIISDRHQKLLDALCKWCDHNPYALLQETRQRLITLLQQNDPDFPIR